jgi:hypothetical protein
VLKPAAFDSFRAVYSVFLDVPVLDVGIKIQASGIIVEGWRGKVILHFHDIYIEAMYNE